VRWLISRKAADRLQTWQFTLLWACTSSLGAATAAVISMLSFPHSRFNDTQHWLMYGVAYTISAPGFALLGRHKRMRREQGQLRA
jgi:hypothetical protein